MSRRKPDPVTGELQLTYRERIFINEYIKNGGNGKEAAIAAGYGAARADQSAYQVLHRIQVHQQIQERISESGVCANEVIGTLASFMRGNIAELLDDDCKFDLTLVKERGLGHLLKTITCTTREIETEPGQPPHIARDYRIQLHSPVQAASILARLMGLNRRASEFLSGDITDDDPSSLPDDLPDNLPDNPDNDLPDDLRANDHSEPTEADSLHGIEEILDPSFWMERLIKLEMQRQGRSRSEVIQTLIELRPEAARFIRPEPGPHDNDSPITHSQIPTAANPTVRVLDPQALDAQGLDPQGLEDDDEVEHVDNFKAADDATSIDDDTPAGKADDAVHDANAVEAAGAADDGAKFDSTLPQPNPAQMTAPLPQDSVLSSPRSSYPTDASQILSPEQLKRIADIVRNPRKLNATQCLESDAAPLPNARPETVSKTETVPNTKT